jgi:hypothetical protein
MDLIGRSKQQIVQQRAVEAITGVPSPIVNYPGGFVVVLVISVPVEDTSFICNLLKSSPKASFIFVTNT